MSPDELAELLDRERDPRRVRSVTDLTVADRLDWDDDRRFGRSL